MNADAWTEHPLSIASLTSEFTRERRPHATHQTISYEHDQDIARLAREEAARLHQVIAEQVTPTDEYGEPDADVVPFLPGHDDLPNYLQDGTDR